ncbi:chloride channel protein [Suttonella sp. R2A3]|uniref:chloride channel protein n=1 Tax=Suttonella sp. R2A3 TaxID=2908648 RepID=UPI001F2D313B|nr:chloride channel protein [Suttonella sp. R2A3]UJF25402.1 chloride channel protein [Suttonella sp. R2A3]
MPIVVGILVAMLTSIFYKIIHLLSSGWQSNLLASALDINVAWIRAAAPLLCAPILIFLLYRIPERRQHSQADVIESIHIDQTNFNLPASLYSVCASMLALGSGYSVGQHGPIVQLGAALGYFSYTFKLFKRHYMHVCIGAGVAAAIAAIFHTPIAAVVFAHEVIFRFFSVRAVAPVTISAVISHIFATEVFNIPTFLSTSDFTIENPLVHLSVILSAIIAGLIGTLFIKAVISMQLYINRRKIGIGKRIMLAAVLMAITGYFVPEVMGISSYFLHSVTNYHDIALSLLVTVLVVKLLITTCTLGLGVPGGIFSPALFFGAVLGAIISKISVLYFPVAFQDNGMLVIATMATMASAIVGAPISMILICLEFTGDFSVTSAVMLGVVIANIIGYRLLGVSSFFDAQLRARGINMEVGRDMIYLKRQQIMGLVDQSKITISADTSLKDAETLVLEKRLVSTYVIDDEGIYLGRITLLNIRAALRESDNSDQPIREFVEDNGQHLYRHSSLWEAVELMGQFDGTHIPILESPERPIYLGTLYESKLIQTYLNDMQQLRSREHQNVRRG